MFIDRSCLEEGGEEVNAIIVGLGVWLIIDGVGSMILYEKQSWMEQAIRVVRVGVGLALIYLGWGLGAIH